MKTKHYEVWLPYFKQGCDLYGCWKPKDKEELSSKEAFLAHAEMLGYAAEILNKMAEYTDKGLKLVGADTHYIGVECPEELGEVLVKEGLLYADAFDEEEEED